MHSVFAQDKSSIKIEPYVADQKFIKNNFEAALDDYLSLLELDPKSPKYNYNIAVCYLNTNINKTKAIPYLELLLRNSTYDPNALYLLGRAYSYAYRFDEALESYSKFRRFGKGTIENLQDVDRQIQFCINAKELIKFPVDVTFENLGTAINSPYADYYPYVPSDESFIMFNSRRAGLDDENMKDDGTYAASIYLSKVEEGKFGRAKSLKVPIKKVKGEQEIIGLTGAGDLMLVYYTNEKGEGDIYSVAFNKDEVPQSARKLGENINSSKAQEIAASVNNEGTILYFASNRSGGMGGTDIYKANKLPNGKWGLPQNLGPKINTPYDEDFPNISPDGKTLYFSSNGYTSMGGYDIFKAEMNAETEQFSNPRNLGYPINTPQNNYNFRVSNNGEYGYMSALRPEGLGDLDIYRIKFNSVETRYSVVKGNLYSSDSTSQLDLSSVFISVTDTKSKSRIGNYLPNQTSGTYLIILPPGEYAIEYTATGFETITKQTTILDKSSFQSEIIDSIYFKPLSKKE